MTLTQGHGCDIDKHKFACLQDKERTTQTITTKLSRYISLLMANFLRKFWMCFFKVKHSIGHISGMVGLIDVKRIECTSVGYWVNYVTLTCNLTHDLDLWFFKVKFQNSCIWRNGIWLMWNKKKANQLDTGWLYGLALWPHLWHWPCSLKVKVWNRLIWGMGMGALIDAERKGCELWVDHSWCWLWPMGNRGGVGGCTV